jgi:putative nucleotidyltransferase with HDIG domain
MQRVEKVLERVTELPFSPVAARILELARDERIGAREIARTIAQDQAFTARLLKIANSPYYGQTRAVTTVTQAVPVLGIDTISSLALALHSFSSLAHDDNAILTLRDLWEHSMACGFFSRQIAKQIGHPGAEEAFIAGLLHDMGKALFYRFFKSEFLEAVQKAENEGISMIAAEQSLFGTDHAAAGAVVARKWNLPPVLSHTIQFHHEPLSLPEHVDSDVQKTIAIVYVADILSEHFQIGRAVENPVESISDEIWDLLGLDMEDCNELLGVVLGEVNEFRKIFNVARRKPVAREQPQNSVARAGETSVKGALPLVQPNSSAAHSRAVGATLENVVRIMDTGKQLALLAGLEDLYPNIANQTMALLNVDAAHIFLPQEKGFVVAGAAGFPYLKGKRFPSERSIVGWVAKMDELVALPNIEKATASWEKDFFSSAGFRAHLFLPVGWAGKRLAVLSAHARHQRLWNSHEIALFNAFGGFVAVALENARLYREAEDRAKALAGLNQELAEALHVKSRFLATVSHELRSPLFVITGYANLIAEQMFGPVAPGMGDALEKITKQANGLITIITCLLEISQMDAGTFIVRQAPFDLRELFDEVTSEMPKLIGSKPITFEAHYPNAFSPIITDRDRFKQVLGRLLENAAKFTQEGKIILRGALVDSGVEVFVEDTGIGIEPEHQKVIFDGFRQVEEEDNRRYEGMGLGLYLSRRILELLGGKITVESEPGVGSRFRVWLPCEKLSPNDADGSL